MYVHRVCHGLHPVCGCRIIMHFYADGVELLGRYIDYKSFMFVSPNYILS